MTRSLDIYFETILLTPAFCMLIAGLAITPCLLLLRHDELELSAVVDGHHLQFMPTPTTLPPKENALRKYKIGQ